MEQNKERMPTGAPGGIENATDLVKSFCEEVREDIEKKMASGPFEVFSVLKYRSQLVAGTNYFVKIQIKDAGDCIHVRLFEPLPCYKKENSKSVELVDLVKKHNTESDIAYF